MANSVCQAILRATRQQTRRATSRDTLRQSDSVCSKWTIELTGNKKAKYFKYLASRGGSESAISRTAPLKVNHTQPKRIDKRRATWPIFSLTARVQPNDLLANDKTAE